MKTYILVLLVTVSILSCGRTETKVPEPHLELGQRISFVGGEPEKTYVVVGYRHLLEDKTDKRWSDQEYIVISYHDNQGEIKVAPIHRNAILKR